MRYIILLALTLLTGSAWADMEAKNQWGDTVRLSGSACPAKVASVFPAHLQPHIAAMRAAVATVGGVRFEACWLLRPDGMVFLAYEDGDGGLIPMTEFKQIPEA